MTRARRRLRLPAFLASLFWLFGGYTDAAALEPCPYHGHGDEAAAGVADAADSGNAAPDPHAAHRAETAHPVGAVPSGADHHSGQTEVDPLPAGDHECDCGPICCVGAAGIDSPQAGVETGIREPAPGVEVAEPAPDDVGAPTYLLPFFLPLSHAPPSA
jgi:hypothetical protein